jgi:hypothetical protein
MALIILNRSIELSNIAAPLSNYLGDFSDLATILALPKAPGNYADFKQFQQSDIQYYYDNGDDQWLPRSSDFKGYFANITVLKLQYPDPLTTWKASQESNRSQNFMVYAGEWILEPTTLDAAYMQSYVDAEIDALENANRRALAYTYQQSIPSAAWVINHPLDRMVSVSVVDTSGSVVFGKVTYVDRNKILIDFNSAFSGEAYLT